MKLQDLDFIRLIPQFMRDDQAVRGLANGLNQLIPDLDAHSKRLSTWDCIDELPESEIDALAWELNILWYDYGATIETKRDLVKNSDKVWAADRHKMGGRECHTLLFQRRCCDGVV